MQKENAEKALQILTQGGNYDRLLSYFPKSNKHRLLMTNWVRFMKKWGSYSKNHAIGEDKKIAKKNGVIGVLKNRKQNEPVITHVIVDLYQITNS